MPPGTLSLLIVRASGYRPRAVGAHYNTFVALEAADPAFAKLSAYFDGCRIKRNSCEYDLAGAISDTDADGLLKTVRQFATDADPPPGLTPARPYARCFSCRP
jgi:hypothetical protein